MVAVAARPGPGMTPLYESLIVKPMQSFRISAFIWTALTAALPVGCAPRDPIAKLVANISRNQAEGGMIFPSGPFQPISSPPTAPTVELVAQAFRYSFRDRSAATNFAILTTQQVRICGDEELARLGNVNYTAVLVSTAGGQRIVLLQYSQGNRWWNRVYDAP